MDKQYDSFVFYRAWWDAICNLPSDAVCEVMNIVCRYVFEGEQPSFDPMSSVSMAVQFIIKDIDGDKERYEDICRKRKEAGRIGGKQRVANFQANQANGSNCKQNQANQADKDRGYRNRIEDKDKGIGENKNDFLFSPPTPSQGDGARAEREKKEKVLFDLALYHLSNGKPNGYAEAEAYYAFNESLGWQRTITRKNGDQEQQTIRDKVAYGKGWQTKNEQLFAPTDGKTMAAILQQTGCLPENKSIIDGFRGFRQESDTEVTFLYTTFRACDKLRYAIDKNSKINAIVFTELRKQFPTAESIMFKLYK